MSRFTISIALIALLTGTWVYVLRRGFPDGWRRYGKRGLIGGVLALALGSIVWVTGRTLEIGSLSVAGMFLVSMCLVTTLILVLSLPFWAGPRALVHVMAKRVENPARRRFLFQSSGALPALSVAMAPAGTAAALLSPVLRRIEIPVAGLPPALDGLKILQLTDIHLGPFIEVEQVEQALALARSESPDMVVLTGDVADDLKKLPRALEAVRDFAAPLGAFACIGNHEIYRGRAETLAIYERAGVRMLCDEGVRLEHAGTALWLAGIDDPARLGEDHATFYAERAGLCVGACPADAAFRVLLCHRPEGFKASRAAGFNLTLSGHTHGGQVAVFGRSFFSAFAPAESYLLGHYLRDGAHLYTSAGLGHWMPFRLNCPAEAALVVLRRAPDLPGPSAERLA